jgi:FG-GAP repeat/FG-GAP-like repeat/Tetratricopeptide repeat
MRVPRLMILCASALLLWPSGTVGQTPPEFRQALQKFSAQDFAGAVEILRNLTEATPDFPNGWLLLGRSLIGIGQGDDARTALEHALQFSSIAGQAEYYLGLSHAQDGALDAAFAALGRAKASGQVNMTNIGLSPLATALKADARYRSLFPTAEEYAAPFVEDGIEILRDWVGEAPGDQFGWIARNIGDVDGDGLMDVVTSSPTWQTDRGKVYVYSSGSGALLWAAEGEAGDQLGTGIDAAGDMNADGIPDVAGGAPGSGTVFVWSGRDGGVIHTFKEKGGISFGGDVSDAGDLNGDGYADLLVGSSGAARGAGMARVYSGADGSVLWEHTGKAGENFGSALGGWQFEGERLLAIGAPGAGAGSGGATYVFRGLADEPTFSIQADSSGAQNGAMFVSILGDVDGDGTPDVYSSDWADGVLGRSTGRIYVHSGATGERLYALGGEAAGDGFGIGVADAGDMDGDGLADLVIGAWQHRSAAISGGKVYVYSGKNAQLLYTITGKVPGETFGFDATGIGDINGDGVSDLLLTSAWSGINGSRSGRTLIVAGKR